MQLHTSAISEVYPSCYEPLYYAQIKLTFQNYIYLLQLCHWCFRHWCFRHWCFRHWCFRHWCFRHWCSRHWCFRHWCFRHWCFRHWCFRHWCFRHWCFRHWCSRHWCFRHWCFRHWCSRHWCFRHWCFRHRQEVTRTNCYCLQHTSPYKWPWQVQLLARRAAVRGPHLEQPLVRLRQPRPAVLLLVTPRLSSAESVKGQSTCLRLKSSGEIGRAP